MIDYHETVTVYLPKMTVKNHLIEDAQAIAMVRVFPPEKDVGIMSAYVSIEDLRSITGRPLPRISKALFASPKHVADLEDDIAEELNI